MSWLAAAFELIGSWLVGNKMKAGFILLFFGCSVWIYVALRVPEARGLLLVVVPALLINIRNYRRWWKQERNGNLRGFEYYKEREES